MSESHEQFSKLGFTKAFVFPALSIFLIPAITLAFFLHAQKRFDAQVRESVLAEIRANQTLGDQERNEAVQYFSDNPMSTLILDKEFAAQTDEDLVFYYATFWWMIRLSAACLTSGFAILVLGGIGIGLSHRSPTMQYLSLSVGWNVLRIYAALQTVAQGVMLVALSFWLTALWFNIYIVRLIFVVAIVALGAVSAVIRAIFTPVNLEFHTGGTVVDKNSSTELWSELRRICESVGTDLPDQIIAGIDDNFFVTEMPVTVGDEIYHGRTLYVSLSLLKQLQRDEADAVLAHEMAHFSGKDTLYTKKTAPLLLRYNNYLGGLSQSAISLPIFYFMLCFRGMFEWSLGKRSREREFRADRIATQITSPAAMAGALLRISAFAKYRGLIEKELFDQEDVMDSANISERIEQEFPEFATSFLAGSNVGSTRTVHPFDSHPPLVQRLEAVGVGLESANIQQLLAAPGDGKWYEFVENASALEHQQWSELETRFREYHENTLPYRFLPESEHERAIVEKAFPEVQFEGPSGLLEVDCERIFYASWLEPLLFSEVASMSVYEENRLQLTYERDGEIDSKWIDLASFGSERQAVLDTIARYYQRFKAALQHQQYRSKTREETS